MFPRDKLRDWGVLLFSTVILGGCENLSGFWQESQNAQVEKAKEAPELTDDMENVSEGSVSLDTSSIRKLQARLDKLGYAPGPSDGIVGPKTTRAIKRYQTAHQLPATGQITTGFLRHLQKRANPKDKKTDGATTSTRSLVFPRYQLGAKFLYSNGSVETISRVKSGEVQWKHRDGTTYTTSGNFLLPRSYWVTPDERGTAKVSEDARRLWPKTTGAKVTFTANIAVQKSKDAESTHRRVETWTCKNDGGRELKVLAGTFDTVVLICTRVEHPNRGSLVRTWYYSQKLRHFVRFEEGNRQGATFETVDLVAIQPGTVRWPPIVRAGLARTISHTLETAESGSRIPWTSSGVKVHVSIEPKSRFVSPDGRPCRRYVQVWSKSGRQMHFPAVACKSRIGGWQIPGIESRAIVSLIAESDTL